MMSTGFALDEEAVVDVLIEDLGSPSPGEARDLVPSCEETSRASPGLRCYVPASIARNLYLSTLPPTVTGRSSTTTMRLGVS